MILEMCREAAAEERARIASGLPPTIPEPWSQTTWELLRRLACQPRQHSSNESSDESHE
jgi:hypothetical protein